MTPTPATILRYRRQYPGYVIVFRISDAAHVVAYPDRHFTATPALADAEILLAVAAGYRVLVAEPVTSEPRA